MKVKQSCTATTSTHLERSDRSVFAEHGGEIIFGKVLVEVLDVDVGELLGFFAQLDLALFARHETSDENLDSKQKLLLVSRLLRIPQTYFFMGPKNLSVREFKRCFEITECDHLSLSLCHHEKIFQKCLLCFRIS